HRKAAPARSRGAYSYSRLVELEVERRNRYSVQLRLRRASIRTPHPATKAHRNLTPPKRGRHGAIITCHPRFTHIPYKVGGNVPRRFLRVDARRIARRAKAHPHAPVRIAPSREKAHPAPLRHHPHTLRPLRHLNTPLRHIRPILAFGLFSRETPHTVRLHQRTHKQVPLLPGLRQLPQIRDHRRRHRARRGGKRHPRQGNRRVRQPQLRRRPRRGGHTPDHLEPCRLERERIKRPTLISRIINPGNDQVRTRPRRTRRLNRHLRLRPGTTRIRLRLPAAIRIPDQSIPRRNPNRRARNRQRSHLEIARVNDPLRTRRGGSEHRPHNLSRMLEPATHKIGHTLHSHKYTLLKGGKTPESPKQSQSPSPSDPSP